MRLRMYLNTYVSIDRPTKEIVQKKLVLSKVYKLILLLYPLNLLYYDDTS